MISIFIPYKPSGRTADSDAKSLLHNKNYAKSILIFFLLALVQVGYRLTFALWVKVDYEHQGLGWSSVTYPGYLSAGSGLIVASFPLLFTPILSKTFGIRKTCLILLGGLVPVLSIIPWTYKLSGVSLWIILIFLNGMCTTASSVSISFISMAISNSVGSDIVGTAMGISQSASAMARCISSAGAASLFGWSLGWNLFYPFNSQFTFIILVLILGLAMIIIFKFFDSSVEKRKANEIEDPLLIKEKAI